MKRCVYCIDVEASPRTWAGGEIVKEKEKTYLVKHWTPFAEGNYVEFEISKENVIVL